MISSFEMLTKDVNFMELVYTTIGEIISHDCHGDANCEIIQTDSARTAAKALFSERGVELSDDQFNTLLANYKETYKAVSELPEDQLNAAAGVMEQMKDPQFRNELGRTMINMGENMLNNNSLV